MKNATVFHDSPPVGLNAGRKGNMNAIKTAVRDGVEEVDRSEFQALCAAAGKTIMWGLLNVPIRKVGNDWPDYSKAAAISVGAFLPE